MFTGIVQGIVELSGLVKEPGLHTLTFTFSTPLLENLKTGASVAIDGVCLTVIQIEHNAVTFNVISVTLALTTLGNLKLGDNLNAERSAAYGDEIGGHLVSGHVHGQVEIIQLDNLAYNHVIYFKIADNWIKYLFPKGFIALNGASLTLATVDKKSCVFTVCLIPETLKRTTFANKKVGSLVNFEIDQRTQTIVDTISSQQYSANTL